jgi:TonB family protein
MTTALILGLMGLFSIAQDTQVGPVRTRFVQAVCPDAWKAAGTRGEVVIEATVGVDGQLTDVRVVRSIAALDQAALDAVRQWKYKPSTLNGRPVPVIMTATVTCPAAALPIDLTGQWTLASSTLGEGVTAVDGGFGNAFTARQTASDLTLDRPNDHLGRGGTPMPPIHLVFRFDGTKTNTGTMATSSSRTEFWDTTAWKGERLVIQRHELTRGLERVAIQTELWLEPDGLLTVEKVFNPAGGFPAGTRMAWRATFRRTPFPFPSNLFPLPLPFAL